MDNHSGKDTAIPAQLPLPGAAIEAVASPAPAPVPSAAPALSPAPVDPQPVAVPVAVAPVESDALKRLEARVKSLEGRLLEVMAGQRHTSAGSRSPNTERGPGLNLHPDRPPELPFTIDELLKVVINYEASDLHIKAGAPPTVRLHGDLVPVGEKPLSEQESLYLVLSSIPPEKRSRLNDVREIDHAYVSRGVRFRMNAFLERGRVSAAYRMVSNNVPAFDALGLPSVLSRLANMQNGLVLVTGPAGSGKSTTLASVIDWINRNRRAHVVTIEDPIEYFHTDVHSFISQREVGSDTRSFNEALRQALRQDPNVIMVGEMRDTETILTAVTAAETGHLVLSTLHTPSTVLSVDRILDTFSGDQQKQIRMLLSSCLRGVVSQKLLQRSDGRGRIPAVEVLVCTPTISSLILEGNTKEIYPYIQQGGSEGMQTFTVALTRLLEQGLVTREEAMFHAEQTTELQLATRHTEERPRGSNSNTRMNWL